MIDLVYAVLAISFFYLFISTIITGQISLPLLIIFIISLLAFKRMI
jgi:hypothetical protein